MVYNYYNLKFLEVANWNNVNTKMFYLFKKYYFKETVKSFIQTTFLILTFSLIQKFLDIPIFS